MRIGLKSSPKTTPSPALLPNLTLNFVSGILPQGLTFTRASGATVNAPSRYGENLVVNSGFDSATGWTNYSSGTGTAAVGSGVLTITRVNASNRGGFVQSVPTIINKLYVLTANVISARAFVSIDGSGGVYNTGPVIIPIKAISSSSAIYLEAPQDGDTTLLDNVVVRELAFWQPGMQYLGPELITDFVSDTSNLRLNNSSGGVPSLSMGTFNKDGSITVSGNGTPRMGVIISGLTIGRTYYFSLNVKEATSLPFIAFSLGTEDMTSPQVQGVGTNNTGPRGICWVATQTYIAVGLRSAVAGYFTVSSFSLKESLAAGASDLMGVNLLSDGTFDTGAPWSFNANGGTANINSGKLNLSKVTNLEPTATQVISVVAGRTYTITADVTLANKANNGTLYLASPQYAAFQSNGSGVMSVDWTPTAGGSANIIFAVGGGPTATADATVDNVTVKEKMFPMQNVLVPSNVPRIEYDPFTNNCKGLFVEQQRTNALLFSSDFTNSNWVKQISIITANNALSPENTYSATKFAETAAAGQHVLTQPFSGATAGQRYIFSFYARKAERSYVYAQISDNAIGGPIAVFNLNNGTVFSSTLSGAVANGWDVGSMDVFIIPANNGYYRCVISAKKATGSNTTAQPAMFLHDGSTTSYTGDGSSGIFIWGAQLESGGEVSSYIPTYATTATRASDTPYYSLSNKEWNASQDTVVVEYENQALSGAQFIFQVGIGDATNRLDFRRGQANSIFTVNSVGVSGTGTPAPVSGIEKVAVSFNSSQYIVGLNNAAGNTIGATNSYSAPNAQFQRIQLGYAEGLWGNTYIRSVKIFGRSVSQAEAMSLTK